jgi:protein TonB
MPILSVLTPVVLTLFGIGGSVASAPVAGAPSTPVRANAGDQDRDAQKSGDGVQPPRVIRQVKPSYTEAARDAKIEGIVLLRVVVLRDGTVGRVEVVKSLDSVHGLDDQAVKAARQWLFSPGSRQGEPVAVRVTIELTFSLKS